MQERSIMQERSKEERRRKKRSDKASMPNILKKEGKKRGDRRYYGVLYGGISHASYCLSCFFLYLRCLFLQISECKSWGGNNERIGYYLAFRTLFVYSGMNRKTEFPQLIKNKITGREIIK